MFCAHCGLTASPLKCYRKHVWIARDGVPTSPTANRQCHIMQAIQCASNNRAMLMCILEVTL